MTDLNKEILKLKALINNKQSTSIYSHKSSETSALIRDDIKLYVNEMNKKFTFTAANTNAPITIDPRTKTISNVEYIDDLKISDLKGLKQQLDAEVEARIAGDEALDEAKADKDHTHNSFTDITVDTINGCSINPTNNNYRVPVPTIPVIKTDGVMEIGRYLDFHTNYTGSQDYATRLSISDEHLYVQAGKYGRTLTINSNSPDNSFLTIGQESNNKGAQIGYNKTNNYLSMGVYGFYNSFKLYNTGNCEITGTVTASNVLANNETRLAACETLVATKADANHQHTDVNYEITFRDTLTFKDYGGLRWHMSDAESSNGHVSGTLVDKFQIGTEKIVVYDTMSVWNRLTADSITLGLNNGQDLATLIASKADDSMLTALAARVTAVETGKADVNHAHNDYVKTSFNNYDEDPSDNIYFQSWFPQGYNTFLLLEERTKDDTYDDGATLKPQFIEFCHNDNTNNTQKFATYGVDGIEFTNGETIQQGTIDAKINTAITNHNHDTRYAAINHNHDTDYVKPADLTAAIDAAKTAILQQIYPVGAIYTSRSNTNPATVLGFGSWTSIQNQFMYCIPTNTSHSSGGSKKITEANLPAHGHTFVGNAITGEIKNLLRYSGGDDQSWSATGAFSTSTRGGTRSWNGYNWNDDKVGVKFSATPSGTVQNTGSGTDYMPPYITVYAWYRTA